MAKSAILGVRLDVTTKTNFEQRAKRICGDASSLVAAFVETVNVRPAEEIWRFCFGDAPFVPSSEKQPAPPRHSGVLPDDEINKLMNRLGDWIVPQGREVLIAGTVHAGPWRDTSEETPEITTDQEILSWNRDRDLLLRITANCEDGECLIGDGIFPGDLLQFRNDLQPICGDIVLAIGKDVDGRHFATVKHYHTNGIPGQVELQSSNPECAPIFVRENEIEIHGVLEKHIPKISWRDRQRLMREQADAAVYRRAPAPKKLTSKKAPKKAAVKKTARRKSASAKT
jgi:SOS-response transcriptional repressor LexA